MWLRAQTKPTADLWLPLLPFLSSLSSLSIFFCVPCLSCLPCRSLLPPSVCPVRSCQPLGGGYLTYVCARFLLGGGGRAGLAPVGCPSAPPNAHGTPPHLERRTPIEILSGNLSCCSVFCVGGSVHRSSFFVVWSGYKYPLSPQRGKTGQEGGHLRGGLARPIGQVHFPSIAPT